LKANKVNLFVSSVFVCFLVPFTELFRHTTYCNVLRHMREDIQSKRAELWRAGNWLLHDDNAPSNQALVKCEFLAHSSIIALPHPPLSLDLAPYDYFLFPKL
jgi:hypothetical protein